MLNHSLWPFCPMRLLSIVFYGQLPYEALLRIVFYCHLPQEACNFMANCRRWLYYAMYLLWAIALGWLDFDWAYTLEGHHIVFLKTDKYPDQLYYVIIYGQKSCSYVCVIF